MTDQANIDPKDVAVSIIQDSSGMPSTLTGDDVKREWDDSLSAARTNLSLASPTFAYMMFTCKYHWSDDPAIQTAGALVRGDENHIFINPKFWMNTLQTREERAFVILHEILHIFLEHGGRAIERGYNHQLFNIATDYCINLTCAGAYKDENGDSIHHSSKYQQYLSLPTFVLYDERFIDMSSDEIYHLLLEENDNDANKAIEAHGGQPSDENGEEQQGSGDEDGEGSGDGDGNDDGEGDGSGSGQSKSSGGRKKVKSASEREAEGLTQADPAKRGKAGQRALDNVAETSGSGAQVVKNRQSAAAAVASANAMGGIGESEGNMVAVLGDLAKPTVDWRTELSDAIQASSRERTTYNRLSRRTSGSVVFPTLTGNKVRVVFGFDSSGSMSRDDYADVGGELHSLLEMFDAWDLDLITCDVAATFLGRYSSEDDDDLSNMDFRAIGQGGTELSSMIHYANEQVEEGEEFNACITVTDGYIPTAPINEATKEDAMKYIFVVTRGGNRDLQLEDAKVIYMDDTNH